MEDLTDEAVVTRHEKCEHEEKKRFLSYLKLPLGYGRSRSHKRTDSRAESSGANTPDPLSPQQQQQPQQHPLDNNNTTVTTTTCENSPLISPPSTPIAPPPPPSTAATTTATATLNNEEPLPSVSVMRRRTISQSRWLSKEQEGVGGAVGGIGSSGGGGNTPEHMEVAPYEKRAFPLNGEEYEKMLKVSIVVLWICSVLFKKSGLV